MGLFGIKTKKEREQEKEELKKAKEENSLIADIAHWSLSECRDALRKVENGTKEFSYRVKRAISDRYNDLSEKNREDYNSRRRSELDEKIRKKEQEIARLEGRDPWSYAGSDGYHFATRSSKRDEEMKREVESAKRELAELKRERNNIGKEF